MENVLDVSQRFWQAMEKADETTMRAIALKACQFVHIGITANLEQEIQFYVDGTFKPTAITFHNQTVSSFEEMSIVLTDCTYALLLNGDEVSHHFMVSEVYQKQDDTYRLAHFAFTALVY